jgi:hypothetical protein
MNDNRDQQCAQRPLPSPSGSRQDAQSRGRAKSSANLDNNRKPLRDRPAADDARAGLVEKSSFMLQR